MTTILGQDGQGRQPARVDWRVMVAISAAVVAAFSVARMLSMSTEGALLDACAEGARAVGDLPPEARAAAVVDACAPLISDAGCREALRAAASEPTAGRRARTVAACAAAYCGQLSPSPAACAAPLAARDADAAALLGAAMSHHHGADEARALGALLYRLVADPPP